MDTLGRPLPGNPAGGAGPPPARDRV